MGRGHYFILISIIAAGVFSGCVPSPNSGENNFPEFSLLHLFYTPQDSSTIYVWQDSSANAPVTYTQLRFDHQGTNPYSQIYQAASFFWFSDTSSHRSGLKAFVIRDSIVIEYVATDSAKINPVIRLSGILNVTAAWTASQNFVTSNGATVKIGAVVDDYFAATTVAGNQYSDVYHITYTVEDVTSASQPKEAEYQKGATLGIYYVKTLGPTYMIAKGASGNTLWINQLVETHTR